MITVMENLFKTLFDKALAYASHGSSARLEGGNNLCVCEFFIRLEQKAYFGDFVRGAFSSPQEVEEVPAYLHFNR